MTTGSDTRKGEIPTQSITKQAYQVTCTWDGIDNEVPYQIMFTDRFGRKTLFTPAQR